MLWADLSANDSSEEEAVNGPEYREYRDEAPESPTLNLGKFVDLPTVPELPTLAIDKIVDMPVRRTRAAPRAGQTDQFWKL